MYDLVNTFFNVQILMEIWPHLLRGLWVTMLLTVVSIPLAALGGLIIAILCTEWRGFLRGALLFYVDVMRAIPPLVLLIFLFYALPLTGLRLSEYAAAVLALVLNGSSYFAEIFRAGLQSVPRGQREAARSTGLSIAQTMMSVVVPQATRNVLPDLISNTLELTKQTSIASAVALQELLRVAQIAQGAYFSPTPLVAVAIIYLIMFLPVVRLLSRLQNTSVAK